MVMEVSPLQFENAFGPIESTELGMVMEVSPLQFENASYPMVVTELEMMVMAVSPLHP